MALNPIVFLLFVFILFLNLYFFVLNKSVLRSSLAYASFLVSALLATFFLNLGDILITFHAIPFQSKEHIALVQLGKIFFAISFYVIYLFVKDLNSDYFNRVEYGVVTYFLLQYVSFAVYIAITGRVPGDVVYGFSNLVYNILGIFAIGVSSYYHYRIMMKLKYDPSSVLQFLALSFVTFSFLYGVINWSTFTLHVFFPETFRFLDMNESVSSGIALVGVVLYVVSYLYNAQYVMKFPFNVHVLIISQKAGLPVFACTFSQEGKLIVPGLLVGALTAVQHLFQEISHSSIFIDEIRSQKKTFVLESIENMYAFLLSDNNSLFLKEGLKRFLHEFTNYFHDEILNNEILNDDIDEVKDLLYKHFPYLPLNDIEPLTIT